MSKLIDELRAAINALKKTNITALVRAHYEEIDNAISSGVSYEVIARILTNNGNKLTTQQLAGALRRIRQADGIRKYKKTKSKPAYETSKKTVKTKNVKSATPTPKPPIGKVKSMAEILNQTHDLDQFAKAGRRKGN